MSKDFFNKLKKIPQGTGKWNYKELVDEEGNLLPDKKEFKQELEELFEEAPELEEEDAD